MARIENQTEYPVKPSPAPSDFLIGTDSQDSNKSVSFSIGSISETIGATFYTADGTLTSARTVTVPSTLEFPLSTSGSEFLIQRTAGARFRVNDLGVFVGSGVGAFPGMQYEADYSANYVNRSLVDKQYVDNTSAVAAGNDKSVQFNSAGVFAGSDNITISGIGASSLNLADNVNLNFGATLNLILRHNSGTSNNEVISKGFDLSFILIGPPSIYSFELTNSSSSTAFQITDALQANTLFYVDGTGATAIGTNVPTISSILDINSTTRGFLKPRMTTVQRDAIATPATGLEIYNTTDNETQSYNGAIWSAANVLTLYSSDGTITGNRIVTLEDNLSFISTTADLFNVSMTGLGSIDLVTDGNNLLMDGTSTVFTDTTIGLTGIRYAGDYSATFVARSLIDKAYSDNNSFLLNDLNLINLNRNIAISDTDDSGDFFKATSVGTNNSSEVTVQSTLLNLSFQVGGLFSRITFNSSEATVEDGLNTKGLVYAADYSSNYTDRSIIDKAYVDSAVTSVELGFSLTTGVREGGLLSPNVDTTKFDISDGFGYVIDSFTDPENPVTTKITWTGLTALTPTNIATEDLTSIAIGIGGVVIQQNITFTEEQSRDVMVLGTLVHTDNVNITSTEDMSHDASSSYLAGDLGTALGNLNIQDNTFNAASTDLSLRKEAGISFRSNVNRNNNLKDPNFLTSILVNPITFLYTYDDGSGGNAIIAGQTDVDPSQYDDGTGTLASVPVGNNWTNQWCYFFPGSNILVVRYGETVYSTLILAQAAALTEIPTTIGVDFNPEFIRTIISVKQGTVDLTNIANAAFTHTGKFGLIGG